MKENLKIDIVIPVYNEEEILEENIDKLVVFLRKNLIYENYKIIIVDNGSTDKSFTIAQQLQKKYNEIVCLHLDHKGRGGALKKAWLESRAEIVSYMDADLSTDLKAFSQLIDSLVKEGYDIVVGSRLLPTSRVKRSLLRKILSQIYNVLIKNIFDFKQLPDTQCGFKALSKKVVDEIVPRVKNQNWFFDTELLILAERMGFKIKYIPIDWKERSKTKVRLLETIFENIASILKLLIKRDL